MSIQETGESLGGGVDLEKVENDPEFAELASLSTEQLDQMLMGNMSYSEVTLSTPDNPTPPPTPEPLAGNEEPVPTPQGDEELEVELAKVLGKKAPKTEDADGQPKVPLAALKDARDKGRTAATEAEELKMQNAFLLGQLEAMKASPQAAHAPAAPATPEVDPIAVINTQIATAYDKRNKDKLALAEAYDNAEFGMAEFLRRQEKLEEEYYRHLTPLVQDREMMMKQANTVPVEVQVERLNSDPWVAQKTEEIRQANPWIDRVPDPLFETIKERAVQALASQSVPLDGTAETTIMLRQKIAEIGKQWGLDSFTGAPATPVSTNPTVDQRKDKLALAANHPPTIGKAGVASQPDDMSVKLASEKVTATEIASSVPKAELERMLGIS